jgi:hypothetical protein
MTLGLKPVVDAICSGVEGFSEAGVPTLGASCDVIERSIHFCWSRAREVWSATSGMVGIVEGFQGLKSD